MFDVWKFLNIADVGFSPWVGSVFREPGVCGLGFWCSSPEFLSLLAGLGGVDLQGCYLALKVEPLFNHSQVAAVRRRAH